MFEPATILFTILVYMGLMFLIAVWAERRVGRGNDPSSNALVYTLSLTTYITTWTYYGSTGEAARSGAGFMVRYIGPMLMAMAFWIVLRKMIRIKNQFKITSLADFIAGRYGRSQAIGALVSIGSALAMIPYLALQIRSILVSFQILAPTQVTSPSSGGSEPLAALFASTDANIQVPLMILLIVFTIVFGLRRHDPSERQQGVVMVIAAQAVIKLIAVLAIGVFASWSLREDWAALFRDTQASKDINIPFFGAQTPIQFYTGWSLNLIVSAFTFLLFPRQFHTAVVENSNEKHVLTAMWLLPLYLFLTMLFLFPLLLAGPIAGVATLRMDYLTLLLPVSKAQPWLAMISFLGGFSAAIAMIIITTMALSIMISNYLFLPLLHLSPRLAFLRRHIRPARWISAAVILVLAHQFQRLVGNHYALGEIGSLSFIAIAQFAPAAIGGLFWRQATLGGAVAGMTAGFGLLTYTLLLPLFIHVSGWGGEMLATGPFGIWWLKPEQLFGMNFLDPSSHAILWTLFTNVAGFTLISLLSVRDKHKQEHTTADDYVDALVETRMMKPLIQSRIDVPARPKILALKRILDQYLTSETTEVLLAESSRRLRIETKEAFSVLEFADLAKEIERRLSGAIGTAAAHRAFVDADLFTDQERDELTRIYSRLMVKMRIQPEEMKRKIDYYFERDALLRRHSVELAAKVSELDREVNQRRLAEAELRETEQKIKSILNFSPEPICLFDLRSRFLLVNAKFSQLFSLSEKDILGKTPTEIFPKETGRFYSNGHCQVLRTGGPVQNLEEIVLNAEKRYFIATHFQVYDREYIPFGICSVLVEITEQKKAESELTLALKAAESAAHARSVFLASIGHEFKTSLNAILGAARLIEMEPLPSDPMEYTRVIIRNAEALAALVQELPDMSTIATGKLNQGMGRAGNGRLVTDRNQSGKTQTNSEP